MKDTTMAGFSAMFKCAVVGASIVGASAVHGANSGWPVETTAETVKGEWMDNFAEATNLAYTTKTPMVMFWANTSCEYCAKLEAAINSQEFKDWQKAHPQFIYNFVYAFNGRDLPPNLDSGAKEFAQTANGTMTAISYYPFVCFYWPKADGTFEARRLVGREGGMDEATYNAGGSMAAEFAACIENFCDGYVPIPDYAGGDLAFADDYAHARLEAEEGFTTHVDIPLVREGNTLGWTATNQVTAKFGDETLLDEQVAWGENQLTASVRIQIPAAAKAGDEIAVTLNDQDGNERGTVSIHIVGEQENSTKNPHFIGERTTDTLGYGEWTMDLNVAMEKYNKESDSRLLAIASGSLWCPDCVMTDAHVLENPAFKAWAQENKVILVDLDVPNFPRTTTSACLLTRVTGLTSDGYISGRGTLVTNELERFQSGAGYLSRHMVSDKAAADVLERNRSLVGENTLNGGWNNPDRANQNRTGIPNFFALRRDGTLAGTFETFDAIGPSEFKEAYLKRFTELVELGATSDGSDLANRSWQTTTDVFAGEGEALAASLSALDLVDTYALSKPKEAAVEQAISVKGDDADTTVTVSLVSTTDGTPKTIATATGKLSDGVSISSIISSKDEYYVSVAGSGNGTLAADSPADSTVTAYTMTGTRTEVENPFSNDWTKKIAATSLPLFDFDGTTLSGTLALTMNKNGKISAKYSDGKKTLATFSGKWDADIAADGTATATLEKKGYTVSLVISADGAIAAEVDDGETALSSGERALADDYGAFSGSYNVAFMPRETAATTEPAGAPFMTLKMGTSKAAKAKGAFNYKIYLPDGKKLSGSTNVTWLDANFGVIPVLKTSGVNTFSATLIVRRNAGEAESMRAILPLDGTVATWTNTTKGNSFTRTYDAFGSWYDKRDSLLVGIDDESLALTLTADTATIADSPTYGALESVVGNGATITVTDAAMTAEKLTGFTFKVNRSTGIVTGSARMNFADKDRVAAKFTGILLRGWFNDCDCGEDLDTLIEVQNVSFAVGYCLFSDRIDKKPVKRSFPVMVK